MIAVTVLGVIVSLLYIASSDSEQPVTASAVGKYESVSPSFMDKVKFAILQVECFKAGRELILSHDATFTLGDSTIVLAGTWRRDADIIHLHFLSGTYSRNDVPGDWGKPPVPANDLVLTCTSTYLYDYFTNAGTECAELFKLK